MRPAVDAIQQGKQLQANKYRSAAQVFFMSAVEILLKATLLRPVICGLKLKLVLTGQPKLGKKHNE